MGNAKTLTKKNAQFSLGVGPTYTPRAAQPFPVRQWVLSRRGVSRRRKSPHGSERPLDAKLRQRMQKLLAVVDDHDTSGSRLADDAARLWRRVKRFIAQGLINADADLVAAELACYALQLPMRQRKSLPTGKLGRTSLKDRSEQAAELLVSQAGDLADESLLDRTTRLLHEVPQRSPMLDEAKLLADALNLDDFGVIGLIQQAIALARQGDGVKQVSEGCEKREQYGYWDARLRDGFHFEPIRRIARRRLEHTRQVCKLLGAELEEDESSS